MTFPDIANTGGSMEPIEELSKNMAALLEDIAEKREQLDRHGQKVLLEALRKLLIALKGLDEQIKALPQAPSGPQPQRPRLWLVKGGA